MKKTKQTNIDFVEKITEWVGSMQLVRVHIIFICGIFIFTIFGTSFNLIKKYPIPFVLLKKDYIGYKMI